MEHDKEGCFRRPNGDCPCLPRIAHGTLPRHLDLHASNGPATGRCGCVKGTIPAGGPAAHRDHSLTLNPDDGLVYLFGGRTAGVADNELWMYHPKSASWQEAPASGTGPPPRFAHNAMYDRAGKGFFVTLGQGNGSVFSSDVWAYDGGSWTQLDEPYAERPAIRYGSGGALDPDANRLLITHGFTDVGRFDDTWAFDLGTGA